MESVLKANPIPVTATEPWLFNLCKSPSYLPFFLLNTPAEQQLSTNYILPRHGTKNAIYSSTWQYGAGTASKHRVSNCQLSNDVIYPVQRLSYPVSRLNKRHVVVGDT